MNAAGDLIEEARKRLVAGADADTLYRCWFHRELGTARSWPSEAAYRAAVLDLHRYERGWRCLRPAAGSPGAALAVRQGFERIVAPPEVVPERRSCFMLLDGERLLVDPLASGFSGGYWHIWSAGWQQGPPRRLARVYFNLVPGHALEFAIAVTRRRPRSIWAAKLLSGSHEAGRRDAGLLYLPATLGVEAGGTAELVAEAAVWCETEAVPFTTPLAPGIGRAPDPSDGRSFGQAICDALWSLRNLAADQRAFEAAALRDVRSLGGQVG
jgi:hypothetical protein